MPTVIETVRYIYEDWSAVAAMEYKLSGEGEATGVTDGSGYINERNIVSGQNTITLDAGVAEEEESSDGGEPLPVLKLQNKSDGGEGAIRRGDSRKDLVEQLQKMLVALGYDLGDFGPNKDGVDGDFGERTQTAVKSFQGTNKDWDGAALSKDAQVGPKTGDALNRAMVGKWYGKYETPRELSKELLLVTVSLKVSKEEGVEL